MRVRLLVRALAVVGLILLCSTWAMPAQADDITGTVQRVGWWSKRLGAQPTVAPATFEVGFGTDLEPNSVAAIDVAVPVGPVQTLEISLTELAGTATQLGHIQVCLATPGWANANAGAFDQAPAIDCSGGVADLTRSLEGNWLGDIGGLMPNGGTASLGVILVDDLGAPISPGATVQIAAITITGQTGEGAVPTTPTTAFDPGGTDGSILGPSEGFIPPPVGSVDLPPLEGPATGEDPAATTTTTLPISPELTAPVFDTEPKPWWRLILIAPVALGMGFAAVYGRRLLEQRGISFAG